MLMSWATVALNWYGVFRLNETTGLRTSVFYLMEGSLPWVSSLLAVLSLLWCGFAFRNKSLKYHTAFSIVIFTALVIFSQVAWISQAIPSPVGLHR